MNSTWTVDTVIILWTVCGAHLLNQLLDQKGYSCKRVCVCKRTAQLNLFNNEIKRRFFIFRTTDLKSAKNAPRQAKKVISPSSFGGSTIDDCLASGFTFFFQLMIHFLFSFINWPTCFRNSSSHFLHSISFRLGIHPF